MSDIREKLKTYLEMEFESVKDHDYLFDEIGSISFDSFIDLIGDWETQNEAEICSYASGFYYGVLLMMQEQKKVKNISRIDLGSERLFE